MSSLKVNGVKGAVLIFAVSIPLFFGGILMGLWIISTDEWVSGPATLRALDEVRVFAHEPGFLGNVFVEAGNQVKRGQLLATLQNDELWEITSRMEADLQLLKQRVELQKTQHAMDLLLPVDEDLSLSPKREKILAEKVGVLEQRLMKYEVSYEKGSYSKVTIEDLRIELHETRLQWLRSKQQAEAIRQGYADLRIETSRQNLSLLEKERDLLEKRLAHYHARLERLQLKAPEDGRIIIRGPRYPGQPVSSGEMLFAIATSEKRAIDIVLSERHIRHIKLGSVVRFESATYSAYEYFGGYYYGEVLNIDPLARQDGSSAMVYGIEASITRDHPKSDSRLPDLPMGSTGTGEISIGKRRLLQQLTGWKR